MSKHRNRHDGRGQILVILTLVIPVLVILAGMALDFGVAYVDKTALSKAVDAAALEGMRSLSKGNSVAKQLAQEHLQCQRTSARQLRYSSRLSV